MLGDVTETLGDRLRERPGTFAAMVTFVALFGFVGANAMWHQPHSHTNTFYSTRDHVAARADEAASVTRTGTLPGDKIAAKPRNQKAGSGDIAAQKLAASDEGAPKPGADPTVLGVQATLRDLRLYTGAVDGVMGSRTRQAILAYQAILRLPATGEIDETLLSHLRSVPPVSRNEPVQTADAAPVANDGDIVASIRPTPRPNINELAIDDAPQPMPKARPQGAAQADGEGDDRIKLLQAGLKQFGNPEMEIDGRIGSRTRKAIAEFQEVFRLPVTGEPDAAVFEEMRRQGFIN
jgi:peptidoglycan hydrolase-like protein with peptidoglycan-binding domain